MHHIVVSKRTLPKAIRRIHQSKIDAWVRKGSKGPKPKLYSTAEEVVTAGLKHPDILSMTQSISAGE